MAHLQKNQKQLLARISRISGQLRTAEKKIEDGVSCEDILHLAASIRGAVNGLVEELIAEHLAEHVVDERLSFAERQAGAAELLAVIRRYSK
ncbi:metal/formaldehyde-sensitive transcriptional repressor [Pacificimonas flava]|uniref:metal/formaldehyde-sensitive transcriptional repressor n=1 Tax=Pacificimonas flava TaxID=1234595 RepID=UPI00098F59AC|nr:metal/formaldehyde-sensitive transcriptional repressor [Pacificimonas flava]MBB5279105.1 DNA-binding FrmR family transcriptional regulator [Pacificimonas flava]